MTDHRCLALHPRHKLKYFERAGWSASRISNAREQLEEEFNANYRDLSHAKNAASREPVRISSTGLEDSDDEEIEAARAGCKRKGVTKEVRRAESNLTKSMLLMLLVRNIQSQTNIFDNLPALTATSADSIQDELQRYLALDPEPGVEDPLLWWTERASMYPNLSRMALDYGSIPGTHIPTLSLLHFPHSHATSQPRL